MRTLATRIGDPMGNTLIERGQGLLCMHPGMPPEIVARLNALTQPQRDALHRFRDHVIQGLLTLYETIPPEEVDPILEYFFGVAADPEGQNGKAT